VFVDIAVLLDTKKVAEAKPSGSSREEIEATNLMRQKK